MHALEDRLAVSPALRTCPAGALQALFHAQRGGLCLVDRPLYELLAGTPGARSRAEWLAHLQARAPLLALPLLHELTARSFLAPPDAPGAPDEPATPVAGERVRVVQLVLANTCNLACRYCFTDSIYASPERLRAETARDNRVMRAEDALRYLEEVIALARRESTTALTVQFFGGEPLMNRRALRRVLETFGDGRGHGLTLRYSIVTNGCLIDDELARELAAHNVAAVVSFDSPHGASRPTRAGRDSTPEVIAGIERLLRHGCRVGLNSVLSRDTWPWFDAAVVDFAAEHGISEIGLLLDLDPAFYAEMTPDAVTERVWQLVLAGRRRGVRVVGYWHTILELMAGLDGPRRKGFKMCSATGCQLSIEPNGEVFACKGSSGHFGHVLDLPALLGSENYRSYARRGRLNPAACAGCEIEAFCSGFCLGPLEKRHGTLDAVVSEACEVYRGITQRLVAGLQPHEVPTFVCA